MQVDFYQLSQTPAESALPLIARNTLKAGQRLLVVSDSPVQRTRISDALWGLKDSFLAHGAAGGAHDARQPILLSDTPDPANGARFLALADGRWRDEAETFERVFLLFDNATIDDARGYWKLLGQRDGVERRFWKQQDGRWVQGP